MRYLHSNRNWLLFFSLPILIGCGTDRFDITADTFRTLEKIRILKKSQILNYLSAIKGKAGGVLQDKVMMDYFAKTFHTSPENDPLSPKLDYDIRQYYVSRYGEFYDILFFDSSAFIFYSVRRESDYHTNIFEGSLAQTKLAESLENCDAISFADYENYEPSMEPAAFFIVPVEGKGSKRGWIVFQYAIDAFNSMLTDRKGLGRTGEVYLVNENNYMLSQSRFINESTILGKKVDTEATRLAFMEKNGNHLIIDYRGVSVFSSFELMDIFGNPWIIIAEMDEAEVITNFFKSNSGYYSEKIGQVLQKSSRRNSDPGSIPENISKVDMSEVGIVRPGEIIRTNGVSSCTALDVSLSGNFSYLAHIPPTDDAYTGPLTRLLFSKHTDFVGAIMDRIIMFDIRQYELRNLRFTIVANHDESFQGIVGRLTDYGVELCQIRFLYNPQAFRADVISDPVDASVCVEWYEDPANPMSYFECVTNVPDLGSVVKQIAGY